MWHEPDVKRVLFHRFTPTFQTVFFTVHQFQVEMWDEKLSTVVIAVRFPDSIYCKCIVLPTIFCHWRRNTKKRLIRLFTWQPTFRISLLFFSIDRNHNSWLTNKVIYLATFDPLWVMISRENKNKSHRKLADKSETHFQLYQFHNLYEI